jgi:hypothetical protein
MENLVNRRVLATTVSGDTSTHERILCEARAAAAVRHIHVVTIYAVEIISDIPFFCHGTGQWRDTQQIPAAIRKARDRGNRESLCADCGRSRVSSQPALNPSRYVLERFALRLTTELAQETRTGREKHMLEGSSDFCHSKVRSPRDADEAVWHWGL